MHTSCTDRPRSLSGYGPAGDSDAAARLTTSTFEPLQKDPTIERASTTTRHDGIHE